MLNNYDKFIKQFQLKINRYFSQHSKFIKCKKGCSACCETGEYPFSWIEMGYLMSAFVELPQNIKDIVKVNFEKVQRQKSEFKGNRFQYKCPFLIDGECVVYSHRGITCRVHGLAHMRKDRTVNVPYCANEGLNYSEVYKKGEFLTEPIPEILYIDEVLKNFNGEMGEIRPLVEWLDIK